jgi:hypothetical protein
VIEGQKGDRPHQANYFPDKPEQKWLTMQRQVPGDPTKTEAIHFPVDKDNKFDPNTKPFIAPPNTNKGKTVVPGKGPLFALGSGAIPLGSGKDNGKRSLKALQYLNELVRRELEERDAESETYDYFDEWDALSY